MADQEKDTMLIWIGALILVTITLVLLLKEDETKHLTGGYEELDDQVSKQLNSGAANRM
ncbi:MAG: hypothetical protein P8L84_00790 [Methylococcaceae bacterium]|jgi:hypothetical protein|nr:hypothetical protein [Methylococcaceae bacterium]